uniref:Secreted protein n=1 Tax=Arundo donax TaxID=35708 RepID=A0A0A9CEZ0_ARUDO
MVLFTSHSFIVVFCCLVHKRYDHACYSYSIYCVTIKIVEYVHLPPLLKRMEVPIAICQKTLNTSQANS